MPTSVIALQILLILLPGFAAAYIVQMLALRGQQTDFDKVVESCLYSFIIYAAFTFLGHGRLPFDVVPARPPATEATVFWHVKSVTGLVLTTLVVALLAAIYINHDGNRIFRGLKLTERTARRSIWNDIFQGEASLNQPVQIELEGNRSLMGVLTYYSDAAEDCSLFVEQAQWVGADGKIEVVPGVGVLLTKAANIKSISLLFGAEPDVDELVSETTIPISPEERPAG
jgi:small nuclear ribonucleoprotein (snRNP)-like protein